MRFKIPIIILGCLLISSLGNAQEKSNNIAFTTNPAGATVFLNGEYNLVVSTPASIPANLSGRYKVKIVRPGYESWRGEMTFLPGASNSIDIRLDRKTRMKAGLRSLVIPGWGQHYAGSTMRGNLLTLSAVTSAVGLYFADKRYQDKRADYDIADANYKSAKSIDEMNRLRVIRDSAQRIAYKAETDRRTVFFIGVGIWAYNFIDALIFFPDGEAYFPTVSAIDGGAKLTFAVGF